MKRSTIFAFLKITILMSIGLFLAAFGTAQGESPANIYKVLINNQKDALELSGTGAEPLLKIKGGYLVLAKDEIEARLLKSNLEFHLIAVDIDRDHLALDIRFDDKNAKIYPIIYEDESVRVFQVEPSDFSKEEGAPGLAPIRTGKIKIEYSLPVRLTKAFPDDVIDLNTLIAMVNQDSCVSYVEALQAFPPRVTGSASGYASRDWIYDKFIEFGYDSVVFDSFTYSSNNVQNIVAYKVGTTYPDHHIIVGAHKDAVSGSPGADDNGSGTAGVLEIARVLKDIDTKMTFIFICFTGEEQGLNGSWHYANEAAANGDSIVVMFNMDMIAHYENTTQVKLYYGDDMTYATMFDELADSLPGIGLNSNFMGSLSASDHYPFQQNGYPVVLAHEYVFSTVYHSYQDSTTYMNYTYMTRIIKGCLATAYHANNTYVPLPGLTFSYPGGLPTYLTPGVPETFQVQIEGSSGGVLVTTTGMLHWDIEGQMPQITPMTYLGGGLYDATIPPQTCEHPLVDFWVSAEERSTGMEITDPDPSNPYQAVVATSVVTAFEDDFESDQGWSVSGGSWQRGSPTGGGGQYGNPDPSAAHSGTSEFGYNLNGDYENSMPERHLTSPAIDCSGLANIQLKFWRWLGVEQPVYDHAYIRVSNNGTTWTTIWENSVEVTDNEWMEFTYNISDYADEQATVYIRFTMGESDGAWQYCGWNIDDLEITGYMCESSAMAIITQSLPDWTAEYPYSHQLEVSGGVGNISWSDKYDDLNGTGLTLSSSGLLSGTVMTTQTVTFTAVASDESRATVEKEFTFMVNDPLEITTIDIPDGIEDVLYSYQLTSSGGTGTVIWTDKNNDLSGTGLALSSGGLLSGTAINPLTINITALITDDVGATDETLFSFDIAPVIICGDANGDGQINILDITYIINYLYMGGPAPDPLETADVNNSGNVNILDVTYLIGFLYNGGPAPDCP